MFEVGEAVLLPPEFGSEKKGVLARKEPNGVWLVQIGTTGYRFLAEKDLRPLTRVPKCRFCGALLNHYTHAANVDDADNAAKCPVCGADNCRRRRAED